MTGRNLAMLLTAPGSAAIAVVRLVGLGVDGFLQRHFKGNAKPGRCVHGDLVDGERVLDDPVVVLLPDAPGCDLNVHGGAWVVRSVIELVRREGFDVVTGTDESALELIDGATTLEKEMLAWLPRARTELAIRTLVGQLEAWQQFKNWDANAQQEALPKILADESLCRLLGPPRVAVVGAPNVGKSTLANQLFAQERSITADLPGTTRDWVGEIANIDGLAIMLVDTPGLRETNDAIEAQAIARGGEQIERADLTLLVLDATEPDQSQTLLKRYPRAIVLVNKIDAIAIGESSLRALPGDRDSLSISAKTGFGLDRVRRAILDHFGRSDLSIVRPRWWTRRQRDILSAALVDPTKLREI